MSTNEEISLKKIVSKTDSDLLKKWIIEYGKEHPTFERSIRKRFNPEEIQPNQIKDSELIRGAFFDHPFQTNDRYSDWGYYGFDAIGVRDDLEELLKKIDYFIKYGNLKTAIQICKNMIEIIPEEWDGNFDYEGDVQVMYDGAIDRLQDILETDKLSANRKQQLFDWYKEESQQKSKHEYVGLNTDLTILQDYFLASKEMKKQNLRLLDQKIRAGKDFEKEGFILQKIALLRKAGQGAERKKVIESNLQYPRVRKLKLKPLLHKKEYAGALTLIKEGINLAERKNHGGTIADWKDELLNIYLLKKNKSKVLELAEDLLYHGRSGEKYYEILKAETPKKSWSPTVERILENLKSGSGILGFNNLRAKILVDTEKWEELLNQCHKGGIEYLEQYEDYLRPKMDKELFRSYENYVESEADIAKRKSYENIARILKRMRSFEGGKRKVREQINHYRKIYKRRPLMMKILNKV